MDGVHDIGGMDGFGAVEVEVDEPVFHHTWERSARALVYAVMANLPDPSTSMFRHSIERMDPGHYLTSSYYEHWLTGAASLAVEGGLVEVGELEARAGGRFPLARPPVDVAPPDPSHSEPRFTVGDRVRVRRTHPRGHTRCPDYIRGCVGVVVRLDGRHALPDVEAHSARRPLEATYCVQFAAADLWGDAQPGVTVSVGLWDSYLEAAA